jgi:hypothetical protein
MSSYNNNVSKLKKLIKQKENVKLILNSLEKVLNKKFNRIEISNLIDFLNTVNYSNLYNSYKVDVDKINDYLINIYKGDLNKQKPFDIHEYLKGEITDNKKNIVSDYAFGTNLNTTKKAPVIQQQSVQQTVQQSVFQQPIIQSSNLDTSSLSEILPKLKAKSDQIEFTKIVNYESLWRDANILVDSRYQNIANTDRSKLIFTLVGNTKTKVPGSGIITTIGSLRDIVEIEVFPFSIPYISTADNYYKKITLSILELASISVDAYEDSQFHFMFTCEQQGNLLMLTPINTVFRFYKPITRLNEFSIRFGAPLNPVIFDKDRLNTSNIDYTSNPGIITFSESHNLITGDLIYITNFETKDVAADLNIINEINNPNGHICTRLSNTSISINVDFTQIIVANRPLAINNYPNSSNPQDLSLIIYFGSKRILMPLRIRYIQGTQD